MGPGSTLDGRYALSHRLQEHSRYERWRAHDQTLQRDVVLLCFPVQGANAAAALDAARRAAGIDEARLVRVLDVGRDGETAFVVEEPLTGGLDLVDLLDGGPVPAGEARRMVGEAATALERARVRGLHHGVLGPHSLVRLDDGAVKVRGLAVEGALLGLDDVDGAQASRDDAVGLVALAYAALTGHWPLTTPVGPHDGLPAAPEVVGGIVAASEITAGVPADLDTITRLTLGGNAAPAGAVAAREARGPLTPGDLARQIAPWSSVADPAALVRPPTDDDASASVPPAGSPPASGPTASGPEQRPSRAARGRTVLGMRVGGGDPDTVPIESEPGTAPVAAAAPAAAAASTAAAATAGSPRAGTTTSLDPTDTDALDLGPRSAPDVTGATDQSRPADPTDPTDGAWADVAEGDGPTYGRALGPTSGGPLRMTAHVRLSETLEESDDDLEPPLPLGPLVGRRTAGTSSSDHTGTALAAVAALVVVAAVLGIVGVSRIGRSSTPPPAVTTTRVAAATTPAPTGSPTTSPPSTAAALTPIGIVQAQAWDPQGDNQEGNASAPRSFDGDGTTMWRSQTYRTAPFGGLAKTGIGLILDLGQQQTVKQVQVDLRGGSDVTAYVASRESLDGATSIGTSSGVDGTVTFTAPPGGAKGQLVILWFTKLAPDGEGGFRAQVAEARVSG